MPTRWRCGDDARCAARARKCAGRDRLGKRVAPILRGVPPRGRPPRIHNEASRRKTWVGEPSNNHTETMKKNARVVGCRKRRPQHTRARARSIECVLPGVIATVDVRAMTAPGSPDPFAALGLRRGRCDATDVRRAFRAMAREAHPDKGGDDARFHTLATAHDAALAELAATLRAPERYDWRDGRAAFDGGAPTVGGAAFDARRADAPGETSGRATPATSPSTSPTPSTRAPATSARARALGPSVPSRDRRPRRQRPRLRRRRRPRRRRRRVARPVRQTRRRVPIR